MTQGISTFRGWAGEPRRLWAVAVSLVVLSGCATSDLFVRGPSGVPCSPCDPAGASPDTLAYRVVIAGDAGELLTGDAARDPDRTYAAVAGAVVAGKTATLLLGDNIYPRGLPAPGEPGYEDASTILANQLRLLESSDVGVVVPGNHDWDNSGARGLDRITAQARVVEAHAPGRVRFLPEGGCPGPLYLDVVTPSGDGRDRQPGLRLVFYDSEWLLRRGRPKTLEGCTWGDATAPTAYPAGRPVTNEDVGARLRDVLQVDADVILAAHHPLRTEGGHGGKHAWWHYALLGYPVLRHLVVRSAQDINSAPNAAMRELVRGAMHTSRSRPLIHVAGHEHSLQVFDEASTDSSDGETPDAVYLVSGSVVRAGPVGRAPDMRFKRGAHGFMTIDFMTDGRILLRVIEAGRADPVYLWWIRP